MVSNNVIKLVSKKGRVIAKSNKDLLNGLSPVELQIFSVIQDIIRDLDSTGGFIEYNDNNINVVAGVERQVLEALQSGNYPVDIKAYLDSYTDITDFQQQIALEANGVPKTDFNKLVSPIKKQMIKDVTSNLTKNGIKAAFVQPLREALFRNVVAGANIQDVEKELEEFIKGNELVNGRLKRYVSQTSRDALYQFNGAVNSTIADEFDLDAYQYVGTIVDDTRKQCARWVNKSVLLREELESEINWAYKNGSGMIPSTNTSNFAINRGGYNCRHEAIPFKLTKRERERLEKSR